MVSKWIVRHAYSDFLYIPYKSMQWINICNSKGIKVSVKFGNFTKFNRSIRHCIYVKKKNTLDAIWRIFWKCNWQMENENWLETNSKTRVCFVYIFDGDARPEITCIFPNVDTFGQSITICRWNCNLCEVHENSSFFLKNSNHEKNHKNHESFKFLYKIAG